MTRRTAQCGCGRVQVTVENEPMLVCACHCDFCQKRTGSVFSVQAYFTEDQCVEINGETKVYNGLEVDGVASAAGPNQTPLPPFLHDLRLDRLRSVEGSLLEGRLIGIAVGNFVDPDFPTPTQEYQTRLRHHWVSPVSSADQFVTFPDDAYGSADRGHDGGDGE
jgi:hypothetical protein